MANVIVFQRRLMEKYNFQLLAQAKQTVFAYLFTLICVSLFLMLQMFRKKGYEIIMVEIVVIPLIIESMMTIVLSYNHMCLPLYKHLPTRKKDCKIVIIDQIMILMFLVMTALA